MQNPFVSIIIPLYVICDRFFTDFKKYDELDYKNYEIIVVSDREVSLPVLKNSQIKLFLTGQKKTGPAEKRDLAIKFAKGQICAFIDDDAYPYPNWIKNAVANFKDRAVVAVGGPGITPPDDSFWKRIGGYIIESYLCSGEIQYRFYQGKTKKLFVRDYPAYNLFVRTESLKQVKGYRSTFYGGEDTLLCLKLTKLGKIVYDSSSVVCHHRRSFPLQHLKQIAGVGQHRGYFFKKYPETSRSFIYILPSLLTYGLFLGIAFSAYKPSVFLLPFLILFSIFLSIATISVKKHKVDLFSSVVAGIGILTTHVTYGIYFTKGIFTKRMER